jgi:hypothetical protein
MKHLKTGLMITCMALAIVSCKKDKDDVAAPPSVVGFWKGKYGNGATTYPTSAYAFLFRSNGTVRVFDGADTTTASKAEGTYTVSGTTVNTTYTYLSGGSTFSTTAIADAKFTLLEGSWGSGTNTTSGGKFFVNKQ